jgi:hypothetical protein
MKLIFVRNGAKAYVKNPRVFLREKSAKRGFMKSSSHFSTASGSEIKNYTIFFKMFG